jgi:hypothetical protein
LERGECPVCTGSTYSGRQGEVCHHCGHVAPSPYDELADVDQDQDDELADVDQDQDDVRVPGTDR